MGQVSGPRRLPASNANFADTLQRAIEQRGLSLERIQAHLDDRGVAVSVATLSYWRSGRRQPGRRASLTTVKHLEAVLRLEPGGLVGSLPTTRHRPRRKPLPAIDSLWEEPSPATVLDSLDTHWDADLERVMLHDRLRLRQDGSHLSLTVRQALRARCDGPDRRVVLHQMDDTTVPLPRLDVVRGAGLGTLERDTAGGVLGAELHFCQPLRQGETVIVEYELTWEHDGPKDTCYTRRLRTPLRELLLEVEFEPSTLPARVTAVSGDRESLVSLDVEHRATVVQSDSAPGPTGLRWSWT